MTDKEKLEAIRAEILRLVDVRGYDREMANDLLAFMDSLPNEPVSIDFEQELYKAFGQVKDFTLGMRIAEWFYDMGKNSQEPVSEDLEEASEEYGIRQGVELRPFATKFFKDGAEWQKQQDQSTIELAEDHAMLAGMEKMKEQMTEKAIETTFNVSLPSGLYDKLWVKGCKEDDKLLVIKKDEL